MTEAQICEVKTMRNSGPCKDVVTGFLKTMQILKYIFI
jgi:hypothetical protein